MATALHTAKQFLLLSLPLNAQPASAPDQKVDTWLQQGLYGGRPFVSDFKIPEFKIGSLDTLVLQSEELAKIDTQIGGSIAKIVEVLGNLNESQTNAYKTLPVGNVPVMEYLENFHWQTRKFRLDKSIKDLITEIADESSQLDADVRATSTNYNSAKTNLAAAERKKTGDLSVRSLHDIVKPEDFVLGSDHLTTVLVAVPKTLKDDFEKSYESMAKNVVPCSASILKQDKEYILFNVHLFKKSLNEFVSACREKKFIPRDFDYSEELINQLTKELDSAAHLEQSLRIQLVRLAKTAYSDVFMNWFHIKALRVFVESVLRYGLPPHFNTSLIAVPPKSLSACKNELIQEFGYLGGNAFSKDKAGKIKKQDSSLHEYASLVDTEYEPFVIYTVEL
ncbi:LANO_0F16556g1_1 [Lachancea nothofagi CBS 11611]|uniref:V-type proton ATPase subunit C n=1 Tax=Lachancea nothofagi CBS 11611 TaxID=1266666 RepID=A0A1G4KD87_9SACH|nr:LANO_0F16556g1_1 [Lachancea nothofagi CBS 11611]